MKELKIYFDGACDNRAGKKQMGIGIHADYGTTTVKEKFENRGTGTSNIAEWMACVEALKMALELSKDFDKVIIYSDSQLIVRQFNGEYEIKKAEFLEYYQEAAKYRYELGKQYGGIIWIRRTGNTHADELSKRALKDDSLSTTELLKLVTRYFICRDIDRVEEITKHYAIAALWSTLDPTNPPDVDTCLDANYSIESISFETMRVMQDNIKQFLCDTWEALRDCGLTNEQIGHSLWLTQYHHGAGFFDYSLDPDVEKKLMASAQTLPERDFYIDMVNGEVCFDGELPKSSVLDNPDMLLVMVYSHLHKLESEKKV